MKASQMRAGAVLSCLLVLFLLSATAYGQTTVTTEPPQPSPTEGPERPPSSEPCPKGKRGGAIAGIVVGSVFLWVLPMSIPVLITQTKKLKAHNRARHERRCQYAPRY
jgi:hypothetical protein